MCISSPETNSWSVIYRKNSGEDINITSLTFKNSLLAARTLMVPENYMNRPGFPGEYFICELRLPDHRFRWKHNKLFLLLPEEYGPAFPAIVDCYTSPPT